MLTIYSADRWNIIPPNTFPTILGHKGAAGKFPDVFCLFVCFWYFFLFYRWHFRNFLCPAKINKNSRDEILLFWRKVEFLSFPILFLPLKIHAPNPDCRRVKLCAQHHSLNMQHPFSQLKASSFPWATPIEKSGPSFSNLYCLLWINSCLSRCASKPCVCVCVRLWMCLCLWVQILKARVEYTYSKAHRGDRLSRHRTEKEDNLLWINKTVNSVEKRSRTLLLLAYLAGCQLGRFFNKNMTFTAKKRNKNE